MPRKILLVGNGAREHAIAAALCRSPDVKLFAYMSSKNPGIAALCEKSGGQYSIGDIHNPSLVSSWAALSEVDFAFPSPDAVLEAGVTDALESMSIPCATPIKAAARLEWDKGFARHVMREYRIPGLPRYALFQSETGLDSFIEELGQVAVKPVGLTGGKGVKVSGDHLKNISEAKAYAREILATKIGGQPAVVVEEKLEGEEFTLQAFCDGKNVYGMPAVQDHKRAYENDAGPNTGGMGSYTGSSLLLPFISADDYESALGIMRKTVRSFSLMTGMTYKGILYGQFMATSKGVFVIEFNARFGDPEAMNVLALLKTPLADIFEMISKGEIKTDIQWSDAYTVVKYLVPDGYPAKAVKPSPINVDEKKLAQSGASLFYASVNEVDNKIMTGTSRAVAILGIGKNLESAENSAEAGCAAVSGPLWHRKDIGTPQLIKRRVDHMKFIRSA